MRFQEQEQQPVWCPFYREDSGKSIFCEGITDGSFLRLTFLSLRAKKQQMDIFLPDEKLREVRAVHGDQREVCR